MQYTKYRDHVLSKGKKRILALDGGGIRGLFTVQLLKRLETIIREKTHNPHARLCDYFHLVGGTSTGAIIASAIATGKTADELNDIYRELGKVIFKRSWSRFGALRSKFATQPINEALKIHFGDMTMSDITHRGIGLGIVSKRLDTDSVWIIDNNPEGKYFSPEEGDNGGYLLRQVIRASTAAPIYFNPEIIQIHKQQKGKFVDGGVSPHNNPALQLFMLATMQGYRYNWKMGEDELFILSLGTGSWSKKTQVHSNKFSFQFSASNAIESLISLMEDTTELNRSMMQWLGKSTGSLGEIDSVMGNFENETLTDKPLFSYMRYDAVLEKNWLATQLDLKDLSDKQIRRLRAMDVLDTMDMLETVGQAYAEKMILPEHIR